MNSAMQAATLAGRVAGTASPDADRLAVVCGADQVTYGELDGRAAALAAQLTDRGIGRGSVVALHLPRTVDAIAAMLGVLRCGATYTIFEDDEQSPAAQRGHDPALHAA